LGRYRLRLRLALGYVEWGSDTSNYNSGLLNSGVRAQRNTAHCAKQHRAARQYRTTEKGIGLEGLSQPKALLLLVI
jgi:hypothetical protein